MLLKSIGIAEPQQVVVMWPQIGDTAGEFSYNVYVELDRQPAAFQRVAPVPVEILLPDGRRTRATSAPYRTPSSMC